MIEPQFSQLTSHVSQIVKAALAAADPAKAVAMHLRKDGNHLVVGPYQYRLGQGRVYLVATGKAALKMGGAASKILGTELRAGIIITKRPPENSHGKARVFHSSAASGAPVQIYEAGHPVADDSSINATNAVREMLRKTLPGDLVLTLISGGSSALLSSPIVRLPAWRELNSALIASGCTIAEFNCVRRQLDTIKGGGLAAAASPAACASLILSDVVGNPLEAIGSGPTVLVNETPTEAFAILEQYAIEAMMAPENWQQVQQALARRTTPDLHQVQLINLIVGDVRRAGEAAVTAGQGLGFKAQLLTARLQGEAREVGRVAAALAMDAAPLQCLLLGGETTVTLHGNGLGGRNQELALSAAISLAGHKNVALASFATDGEDGPTQAAGALVTGDVAIIARQMGLDPLAFLKGNDSHNFFVRLAQGGPDCLMRTGPTGTNVNDLIVLLKYPE